MAIKKPVALVAKWLRQSPADPLRWAYQSDDQEVSDHSRVRD